ncbi:MAG: ABC transporter ATP-binding protein [Verrucomicrobia bacterium]|nr:ABC transporter ATP-binding protein [Verrucomicrobiota bacterium]MBV8275887.1 ABC transporter ATP-binding protein [Verrucomicrobiota bacterium]
MLDPTSQLFDRYLDQPQTIPRDLRARLENACASESVQLYGLADLDSSLRLCQIWVALTANYFGIARTADRMIDEQIRVIERSRLTKVVEEPGLSCTVAHVLVSNEEHPFATIRYSHRQRQAVSHVLFAIQQQLEGEPAELIDNYRQSMVRPIKEAQASVNTSRLAIVWRLLGYLKPYRWQVTLGMTGASIMTLARLLPPLLTAHVIDDAIRPFQNGTLAASAAWQLALVLLAGLAATFVVQELAAWVRLRTMAVLGEHVARDLRTEMYDHLHRLSVSFFSSKQTGSIISRVGSDSDRIWDFIAFGVVELSLSFLLLIGLSIVLIALDFKLGLIMSLPLPLLLYLIYRNGKTMHGFFLRAWRKWSNLTDTLSDTVPGIRVVKAFDQAEHEKRRFEDRNESFTDECFRIHHVWTGFWPVLMLLVHLMTLLVWVFALPRLLSNGSADLTTGTFVAFLLYMGMYVYPIEIIGQMARLLNRALSSAHRIFDLLDTEPQLVETHRGIQLTPLQGLIDFRDVTFGYDRVRLTIKGISLRIEPGELIGLVGPSGSGKTTLINLLVRFYDPIGGEIRIDGVPLKELDIGSFRRQVGMVLQDPFLFHGTILENIRYGLQAASLSEVISAAQAANAHDFICRLPNGYDTVVGERGHTLSGGERQRVSIARAILHDPRILILDEATSSVDTETEHQIQEALNRLVAGRTVIAIAHRLSTLKRASRLLVVKDGRLAEQGTHLELLGLENGIYRKLHDMQLRLNEAHAV